MHDSKLFPTTEMKFCIDCKHVRAPMGYRVPGVFVSVMDFTCAHPDCVEPVMGNQMSCFAARGQSFCGDGKYFEEVNLDGPISESVCVHTD